MDLHPNEEQEALRQASAEWLDGNMPLAGARARAHAQWREMAEMGWFGVAADAARGGLGLDLATETLIFAELGRFLAPVAAIPTAIVGKWAPPNVAVGAIGGLSKVAIGLCDRMASVRVLDAASATLVLIVQDGDAALHAAPNLALETGLDPSQQQAELHADECGEALWRSNSAAPLLQLKLLAASYALGAADAARDMGAAYAAMREQFGRAIGSFQGVKHPCADMAVRCYAARAQLLYAACAADQGATDVSFHVAAAKRLCDQAALDNARTNIQIHGGIGMTDQANPHLVLKRAHLLRFIAPSRAVDLL